MVKISLSLKSTLPSGTIAFLLTLLASSKTFLGNSLSKLYSFIIESISTPVSSSYPKTSIIFPSAFIPFLGYLVIFTTTF